MTNKEKKEWLSGKYPLTVIQDRYVGAYSGARWFAFPLDYTDVPEDANGDDTICAQFWHDYKEPVGKGGCAEEAIDNLLMEMEASIPKEIDEEKVRKFLLRLAKRCPEDSLDFIGEVKKADVLAYLEKQKPVEWNNKPCLTCQEYNEGFEAGRLEGVTAGYNKAMKEMEEKEQKEPKPVGNSDFKTKLAEYMTKNCTGYSYNISSESILQMAKEELIKRGELKEQNPSWSEEDEKMKERLITRLNWITYNTRTDGTSPNITFFDEIEWLKSLRPQPHWKPSEEQMKALHNFSGGLFIGDGDCDALRSLYEDLRNYKP